MAEKFKAPVQPPVVAGPAGSSAADIPTAVADLAAGDHKDLARKVVILAGYVLDQANTVQRLKNTAEKEDMELARNIRFFSENHAGEMQKMMNSIKYQQCAISAHMEKEKEEWKKELHNMLCRLERHEMKINGMYEEKQNAQVAESMHSFLEKEIQTLKNRTEELEKLRISDVVEQSVKDDIQHLQLKLVELHRQVGGCADKSLVEFLDRRMDDMESGISHIQEETTYLLVQHEKEKREPKQVEVHAPGKSWGDESAFAAAADFATAGVVLHPGPPPDVSAPFPSADASCAAAFCAAESEDEEGLIKSPEFANTKLDQTQTEEKEKEKEETEKEKEKKEDEHKDNDEKINSMSSLWMKVMSLSATATAKATAAAASAATAATAAPPRPYVVAFSPITRTVTATAVAATPSPPFTVKPSSAFASVTAPTPLPSPPQQSCIAEDRTMTDVEIAHYLTQPFGRVPPIVPKPKCILPRPKQPVYNPSRILHAATLNVHAKLERVRAGYCFESLRQLVHPYDQALEEGVKVDELEFVSNHF